MESGALECALNHAPRLVAADGGANVALAFGRVPDWVIGDFDSISAETLAAIPHDRHMKVAEQETTDFEKCLMRLVAPFILGVGFTGARADHALSVWNGLARYPDRRCVILGETDLIFAAPPDIALDLAKGTRLSLFPMGQVTGRSEGLRWPIAGLDFAPDGRIGTSNEVEGPVRLTFDGPGMLIILPLDCLDQAITALRSAPRWR